MTVRAAKTLTGLAGLAWLVIAGGGIIEVIRGGEDGWDLNYGVFSTALLLGAVASVFVAAHATSEDNGRPRLRTVGLAVCGLGCLACVVAWAFPLWMGLLGLGFLILAIASTPRQRRALALLAAAQLGAIAVLIVGIEAKVGRADEYGDYPAAGGMAILFVAALTLVALYQLSRAIGGAVATRREVSAASADRRISF